MIHSNREGDVPELRRILMLVACTLTLTGLLHAAGNQEDPIRQARELIAENRINDAILLLEQTVREDPERIQEAESLMRTIREIRGEYNVLFEQLINNLVNNPDDIERTLEIIDQMEALDEFPNQRVVEQVQDARVVAQLAFDRNRLNTRMDEARNFLAAGEYLAALEIYTELRELQRDRFETRGYGDIFVNTVNEAVTSMSTVVEQVSGVLPPYRRAGSAILDQARRDVLLLGEDELLAFFGEAEQMADLVLESDAISQNLAVVRSQVALQFPDDPTDWYLNFQDFLARGRPEFRNEEGIYVAVRDAYRETIGQLSAAGREQTSALLSQATAQAEAGDYADAAESYTTAVQTAQLWERAVAVEIGEFQADPDLAAVVERRGPDAANEVVGARSAGIVSASLADLSASLATFTEAGLEREASLFSLESQIASAESSVNTFTAGLEALNTELQAVLALEPLTRSEQTRDRVADGRTRWQAAIDRAMDRERELAVAISQTRTDAVNETIATQGQRLPELVELNEGVEQEDQEDPELVRVARFPDDALAGFRDILAELSLAEQAVSTASDELAGENEYVTAAAPVQEELERLDDLALELSGLRSRAEAGVATAENLIAQAEAREAEARNRIADTRAAISAFQVEAARNNYQAAREAFLEALELREDPALRTSSDELIQTVGAELQELENVIVVRRVRELITQADELYNQDNYVAARDTLLAAQSTWEQTNVESNPEIDRLLTLVTAALSLEEGRNLAVTDPLYPILGNYLSIAREDFNTGQRLFRQGEIARANLRFDRAIENLRNIRDVRPLNWDARILELRIAEIRNPEDFDEIFATRYEQAVGRLDEVGPLEVYSELEVLAEINPDYPGIQQQIFQLEIALNLRENPVDAARVREAANLYNRAVGLAQGSVDQATVAVSLLEEAVDLNPDNSQAKFLLDQLRIRLGGQATVALSTADEEQYRRAETLFSQGQVLQALQIAERLLAASGNQNYPPLVDLRRRIALRLGI